MLVTEVRLGRGARLALLAVGVALGGLSLAIAHTEPAYSLAGGSLAAEVAGLLAGWSLVGAGLAAWARRPTSRSGRCWWRRAWRGFWPDGTTRASALPWRSPLAWFSMPPARPWLVMRRWCTRGGVCGPAWTGSPSRPPTAGRCWRWGSCRRCSSIPLTWAVANARRPARRGVGDTEVFEALNRVGVWLGLVWALLLVTLACWRLLRSTAARRRMTAPVLVPAVVYLILVAWDFQHGLDRGFLGNDAVDRRLWLGQGVALMALAFGVAWEWVRGRRTRSALAKLVVDLAASPPPAAWEGSSPSTLDDPSLALLYPLPDGRRVDALGRPAQPGQGQAVTPLVRGGRRWRCSPTGPASSTNRGWSTRSPPPRAWRLRTSGCRRRSVPSSKTCGRHAPGSWSRATPNAGGWSATSMTAPSSGWSRWRCRCVWPGSEEAPGPTCRSWRRQRRRSARPSPSCAGLPTGCTRRRSPRRA